MSLIRNKLKKLRYPYYVYREMMKKKEEKKMFWKNAVKQFAEGKAQHGNLKEYMSALSWQRFSYDEYSGYRLWNIDSKQWGDFLAEREMQCIYRKTVQSKVARIFTDKIREMELFNKYVHRRWINPRAVSFEAFSDFVESTECFAKPRGGTQGQHAFKVGKGDEAYMRRLYRFCCEHYIIIEEYIRACDEIEAFHPKSLNTIRVVTISKDANVEILDAEFRMGVRDNVVDNAHCGGILASIDIDTGLLFRNGADMLGNEYEVHPDSGKTIKGFVIPHWTEIVDVCKEAAMVVPEAVFAGWDLCVRPDGEIELIEVNAFPGVMGLQIARGKGLKPRLKTAGEIVLGYNPLKLISVWSKSYVTYEGIYGHFF